jgi:prepilin-type N-terminal cleavage/methylation domain-containing protein
MNARSFYYRSHRRTGFTLIELSLVLVILGLLIGGVMAGRALVESAQLRKAVRQLSDVDAAYAAFKLKYNCLAGDCADAANFNPSWYSGNGDGNITYEDEFAAAMAQLDASGFLHANAEVNGTNGAYSAVAVEGVRSRQSWASAGQTPFWFTAYGLAWEQTSLPGHFHWSTTNVQGGYGAATISPADALQIDAKIDDAKPRSGRVMAYGDGGACPPDHNSDLYCGPCLYPSDFGHDDACMTAGTPTKYKLDDPQSACSLTVKAGF